MSSAAIITIGLVLTLAILGVPMWLAIVGGTLPFFLFLFLLRHRSIDYRSKVKSFTYAGILIGCILLSLLNFSLGGVFVRYLCDITLPLALLTLLLVLEYECRLTGGLFARRVILLVFGITIFISLISTICPVEVIRHTHFITVV